MRPGRFISLLIGVLLVIPAVAVLASGAGLGIGYLAERDDDGYFDETIEDMQTSTVAITAEQLDFMSDPGSPDWLIDALDVDVRLRASNADSSSVFVGIALEDDLDRYLAGVAHAEIDDMDGDNPVYISRPGGDQISAPTSEDFWVASATGPGIQQLEWEASTGKWAAVLMNADGSPGVDAEVRVGVRSDALAALAITLLAIGTVLMALAVGLIIFGASGRSDAPSAAGPDQSPQTPASEPEMAFSASYNASPVTLSASLDPQLSRWKWLVKWILAIPHFIVLLFLWTAFVVTTIAAGFAILFTGRYPRGIFDFNVGVLRWSWRVQFYAGNGGIGTDRYPAFGLQADPQDLTTLDIVYPERLSRPRVLIKWLLALPHIIIAAVLAGMSVQWLDWGGDTFGFDIASGGGLLGLLTLVAGVMLLFTETYPRSLFDLIIGLNRWVYRVIAYVALMTDDYPPFRLDQGPDEPPATPPLPPAPDEVDLRTPTSDRELTTTF